MIFLNRTVLRISHFNLKKDYYFRNEYFLSEKEKNIFSKSLNNVLSYFTNYTCERFNENPELAKVLISNRVNLKGSILNSKVKNKKCYLQ